MIGSCACRLARMCTAASFWALIAIVAPSIMPPHAHAASLRIEQVSDFPFAPSHRPYAAYEAVPDFGTFVRFDRALYFSASTGEGSQQLFRLKGRELTPQGSDPGTVGAYGTQFQEYDGRLYFRGERDGKTDLYRTDGGPAKLVLTSESPYGSSPWNFSVANGLLYFTHNDVVDGQDYHLMLGATDGHEVRTVADMTQEMNPGWSWHAESATYFAANGPDGVELYATKGWTATQVADLNPGPADSSPYPMGEFQGDLYFVADDSAGWSIFHTDGTQTTKLPFPPGRPWNDGPYGGREFDGWFYFSADRGSGYDLYRTDGIRVEDVGVNPGAASANIELYSAVELNDRLLFFADGANGRELHAIADGQVVSWDLNPGPAGSTEYSGGFASVGERIVFSAEGPEGHAVFSTDGLTVDKLDWPGSAAIFGGGFYDVPTIDGEAYFGYRTNDRWGWGLASTDGRRVTTYPIAGDGVDNGINAIVAFGDQLILSRDDHNGSTILAISDGQVREIATFLPRPEDRLLPGPGLSITPFVEYDNALWFLGATEQGYRLFRLAAVPEPASATLMGVAFLAFAVESNRRRW